MFSLHKEDNNHIFEKPITEAKSTRFAVSKDEWDTYVGGHW